ncbi:molybdopterin-dependent oxidoreductase [soil metagenome]
MRRRDFLKLSATSAAGAIIFQACDFSDWGDGDPAEEFKIESPRDTPEDYLFGNDAWYATVFADSAEAPGVIVRVFEGRAKKIEGNPNHPVNNGKLNARGQAMLQDLYHPDRLRAPMRRTGPGGIANFTEMSWNEAFDALAETVRGSQGSALFITEPLSGALKQVVDAFVEGIGGERIVYEPLEEAALREAVNRVFGSSQIPFADIGNAQTVLSFGADWLHTWISPVQYSQGYASLRRDTEDSPRGVIYHVDTTINGTSGAADRWVPVNPGYEGMLAMAIAGVLIDDGLAADTGAFDAVVGGAAPPSLEDAASQTGVPAEMIREIADRLANHGPSVVFGGGSAGAHTNGVANLTAIYALNVLLGSVNTTGGLHLTTELGGPLEGLERDAGASDQAWRDMMGRIQGGEFSTVFINQANPVYSLPWGEELGIALRSADNVVSFSRYIDETSVQADLLLPGQTALEIWNSVAPAVSPGYPVVGFQQPVVLRFYDTQPVGDVLLTIAEEVGLAEALPWATMQEVVREQAEALRTGSAGNIQAADDPAQYWTELVQTGVWMDSGASQADPAGSGTMTAVEPPAYSGSDEEFPFHLVPYESTSLGAGQYANLPWMQALPDPITTVTWASWANLNTETAEELEVSTGDIVRVTTPAGELEIQAYVNPATPPNVVAIPMGQGHTHYTRYAEGRGVNVMKLVDPEMRDAETGALAWAATRANVQRVPGGFKKLPRMEGTVEMVAPEDYQVVRIVPPSSGE